jgi:adenine-specific DNA-methyltransferase
MNDDLKMDLTSRVTVEEKREELKRCLGHDFPEIFADGAVNFDELRRVLGDWVDPGKERFGLSWPGKAECMKIIQQPSVATLKPARSESITFDDSDNLFIEGDNLEVLKLLQKAYFGKVKMIYIDPPYNTGNEFIYPDKYAETLETYLTYTGQIDDEGKRFSTNTDTSGRYHSRWLNMIYPRLYLARNLLRDDGVMFISIDDNELDNLKAVCNIIFGEENHVATISIVNNLKGRNDKKNVATCHEYLICYGNENFQSYGLPLTEEQIALYKFTDHNNDKYALRDLRKRGSQDRREDRPNMFFPVFFDERTGKCTLKRQTNSDVEIFPLRGDGSEGRWRWGIERVAANLDILHPKYNRSKDRWGIEYRIYLDPNIRDDDNDEEPDDDDREFDRTSKAKSAWWGGEISTDVASREFKKLFPELPSDYPKSPFLIRRMLQMATKPGDLVMDFFAGYATTAQAVYEINSSEGGDPRRFILVQLPEKCPPESVEYSKGYTSISEIAKERIRRAAKSIQEKIDSQLDFAGKSSIDLGFRSFKLDRSNFKIWKGGDAHSETDLSEQIELHVDNLSAPSTAEGILYELLLKSGFPLTTDVASVQMAGKQVFSIRDGALLICLEKEITSELIDELADANPVQIICLDEGFKGNDQLKANAVQTFKARAQAEESEIVFRTV